MFRQMWLAACNEEIKESNFSDKMIIGMKVKDIDN